MALTALLPKALLLGTLILISRFILSYLRSPLKTLPGPFLAKFTDLWRFANHYRKKHIETQIALHKKYGDVVRMGPNLVSLSDASLVKTIYSTRGTFIKSDLYSINDALQGGRIIQNIFSTRSNDFHARALKPVQKLYSLNHALELEPLMDNTVHVLCSELETRFMENENKGKTCEIDRWISFFAWDFLSYTTFSKRMGFLDQGRDVNDMIKTAVKIMRYLSVVGQIPILDKLLGKNPYCPIKFSDFSVPAGFCVERFMERTQNPSAYKDKDYVNSFLEAKKEFPDLVTDHEVIGYMIINILGGADTTAIAMRAIFYYLLKTPHAKQKLVAELHSSNVSFPVPYDQANALTYLNACIQEGMRIHPIVGQILERVVPSTGLTLSNGAVLPPGTIVGFNAWVLSRDEKIFGPKTDEYVPERWLQAENETKEEWEERTKKMRDADLSFGDGNRVCLGRPIALIELCKVTATLFGKYKIELENPTQDWEVDRGWFVWPNEIRVKMSPY